MQLETQFDVQPEGAASQSWYAIYTRHQHEKTVTGMLAGKGFDVFLPLYTAVHRWRDRTKTLSLPLFPCYVFLRGGLDRRLQIVTTPGLFGFVGPEGRPSPIPDSEIDAIRHTVETGTHVEPHHFLRSGDWVRVTSGPLAGFEGLLVRRKNQFRLVLSIEILQQSAAVEIDFDIVERAVRRRSPPKPVPSLIRRDAFHIGRADEISRAPSFC